MTAASDLFGGGDSPKRPPLQGQAVADLLDVFPRFQKEELMGRGLQKAVDAANSDEDLERIVHSLRYHGMFVPKDLLQ